jgi:hypothetical protein
MRTVAAIALKVFAKGLHHLTYGLRDALLSQDQEAAPA